MIHALAASLRRTHFALNSVADALEARPADEQGNPPLTDPAVRNAWHAYLEAANECRELILASASWLPELAARHGQNEAGEWADGLEWLMAFGLSPGADGLDATDIRQRAALLGERWNVLDRLEKYEAAIAEG